MSDSDMIGDIMRLKTALSNPPELLMVEAAVIHTHAVENTSLLLYKPFTILNVYNLPHMGFTLTIVQCLLSLSFSGQT